jgi:hypothetical protein
VENVVLSNLVINCHRFDWFWWGDGDPIYFTIQRSSESQHQPDKPGEPPAGAIRHVILRNIIAHGQGTCLITGHPKSWLDDISIENVKLFISTDPRAPYDKSIHAMYFEYAKNIQVKDVQINWEKPAWDKWQSALAFEDVSGLKIDNFTGGPAKPGSNDPAVLFDKVEDASISNSRARPGTEVFLRVQDAASSKIYLFGNELHDAAKAFDLTGGATDGTVIAGNNF